MVDDLSHSSGVSAKPPVEKVRRWYRGLPDKKRYFEFITAFLSIPVLITVLISNVSNIQNNKKSAAPVPAPAASSSVPITIIMQPTGSTSREASISPTGTINPTPSPTAVSCTPGIGSVEITYPTENSTVSRDPVCVEITRKNTNYCAVTWSYRINNGAWSDYSDKQICMYGLSSGTKQLDVKVKSSVTGDEVILERNFTVAGITPTPTPQATQSAVFKES